MFANLQISKSRPSYFKFFYQWIVGGKLSMFKNAPQLTLFQLLAVYDQVTIPTNKSRADNRPEREKNVIVKEFWWWLFVYSSRPPFSVMRQNERLFSGLRLSDLVWRFIQTFSWSKSWFVAVVSWYFTFSLSLFRSLDHFMSFIYLVWLPSKSVVCSVLY